MDIDMEAENQCRIVLDGVLSNEKPPYYFRLTKTVAFSEAYNEGIQDSLQYAGFYQTTKIVGREGDVIQCLFIMKENFMKRPR